MEIETVEEIEKKIIIAKANQDFEYMKQRKVAVDEEICDLKSLIEISERDFDLLKRGLENHIYQLKGDEDV